MPVQIGFWSVSNTYWAAAGRESTIPGTKIPGSRAKEQSARKKIVFEAFYSI